MIRYVIALFLINTYSQISGAPADQLPTVSNRITLLFNDLAKNCAHPFIKSQIENVLPYCSAVGIDVDQKRLFQCISFYDINNQLCSAVNNSFEDFSAQVKNVVKVEDLCDSAKEWKFTQNNINVDLTKVFHDIVMCEKFCVVEDLFSTDSIFFCKYFYLGWQKLHPQVKPTLQTAPIISSSGAIAQNVQTGQISMASKTPELNSNIQPPILNANEISDQSDLKDIEIPTKPSSPKPVTNTTLTGESASMHIDSAPSQGDTVNENPNVNADNVSLLSKTTTNPKNNVTIEIQPAKVDIGNSKLAEETGEENLEVGNDPDGDDEENDDGDVVENPISNTKDIRFGADFSQKEFYSPDLTPEDDHFFPFFLTAIILVIVLYILYHNKGKVTKVFLGLIVEGRQNGRRRNSRGHAYRRLDTLEQAMSGNLAAQPSKIIY